MLGERLILVFTLLYVEIEENSDVTSKPNDMLYQWVGFLHCGQENACTPSNILACFVFVCIIKLTTEADYICTSLRFISTQCIEVNQMSLGSSVMENTKKNAAYFEFIQRGIFLEDGSKRSLLLKILVAE